MYIHTHVHIYTYVCIGWFLINCQRFYMYQAFLGVFTCNNSHYTKCGCFDMCLTHCPRNIDLFFKKYWISNAKEKGEGIPIWIHRFYKNPMLHEVLMMMFSSYKWKLMIGHVFAGLGSWSIIKMLPLVIGELHNQKDLGIWNFQLLSGIVRSYLHLGKHHHLFHYWSCCLLIRYGLDLLGALKESFLAPWYTLYL